MTGVCFFLCVEILRQPFAGSLNPSDRCHKCRCVNPNLHPTPTPELRASFSQSPLFSLHQAGHTNISGKTRQGRGLYQASHLQLEEKPVILGVLHAIIWPPKTPRDKHPNITIMEYGFVQLPQKETELKNLLTVRYSIYHVMDIRKYIICIYVCIYIYILKEYYSRTYAGTPTQIPMVSLNLQLCHVHLWILHPPSTPPTPWQLLGLVSGEPGQQIVTWRGGNGCISKWEKPPQIPHSGSV